MELSNYFSIELTLIIVFTTYLIIKVIDYINGIRKVPKLVKRIILIITSIVCCYTFAYNNWIDVPKAVTSAILAPIAWGWFIKRVADFFGIDYNKIKDVID